MLIVLGGSVSAYVYYLKEKKEQLDAIKRGFCPKCHQKSIVLTDKRSGGCSGPSLLSFECTECGYTNTFSVEGGGSC
jgi:DNA-directed RNA polymerase subunit M/transcription elongation factor TFIIS